MGRAGGINSLMLRTSATAVVATTATTGVLLFYYYHKLRNRKGEVNTKQQQQQQHSKSNGVVLEEVTTPNTTIENLDLAIDCQVPTEPELDPALLDTALAFLPEQERKHGSALVVLPDPVTIVNGIPIQEERTVYLVVPPEPVSAPETFVTNDSQLPTLEGHCNTVNHAFENNVNLQMTTTTSMGQDSILPSTGSDGDKVFQSMSTQPTKIMKKNINARRNRGRKTNLNAQVACAQKSLTDYRAAEGNTKKKTKKRSKVSPQIIV